MPLSAGTRLGPYEILGPIGAGGMGEVYRARDTRLDREVAIKVLPERLASDPEALARFQREAKAVASLSHPNILAIHDFGAEGGTAYSVTEMLEGETLRTRLGGAPLPARKSIDYALQIARGLSAAHDKGIVHRDLKPDNLFITHDGRVKILDFGLAKTVPGDIGALTSSPTQEAGTLPGTVMGTMGYMSPEQVRGQAVDHRTDIFAFGAILCEMVTGRPAFRRETAADTLSAILREDPRELSEPTAVVPPAIQRIIQHCLEKSPAERFQSARDLAFDLESGSTASGAMTAATAGAGAAAARRTSRPALAAAAGLAAGLLIGAGLAVWLLQTPALEPPTLRYLTYSGLDREPSASADGRLIAYSSVRDGHAQIWIKQHPGGDEVALTSGPQDVSPRISPDGASVLFVRIEAGTASLMKVPVVGGEPRKVLGDAIAADWSPDGKEIVFVRPQRENQTVSFIVGVVDASGHEIRSIGGTRAGGLYSPRWSPDGRTIALVESGSENAPNTVLLVNADGTGQRVLSPPSPGLLSACAWSGTGASIVYGVYESFVTAGVRGGSGRIIRQDIATGRAETLMWIPNIGEVIDIIGPGSVLVGATSQRQNLVEVALDGAATALGATALGARWLTRGSSVDRQPAFSPDGQWVIFSSNRTGNLDLWKLSTATGAIRRVTEDAADDWDPAFTPDGRQIIWSSARSGHFEIWICASDGTGARQLSDDGFDAENPTATPDGRWIVYNSTNPPKSGIWKIHPDGTGATRIVPGTWSTPEVSPDGAHVAFRTGTQPRALHVARVDDGVLLDYPIRLPGSFSNGRPRWMPDGGSLVFTGTDETGALGVFSQVFSGREDTRATRRALVGFGATSVVETFGISPDGTRLIYSTMDRLDSLMLAEGLPGVEPPRRKP